MSNVLQLPPSRSERPYSPEAKIGCIIQARMTSKRFPGKVLALLAGKPVIQHVIEHCKQIRGPSKVKTPIQVIVAVPDAPESDPLLELVTGKLGVPNGCGPEDNVLERYLGVAQHFNLDVIVRITADCPFINPKICSEVLQLLIWRKLDYASNCHENRTFPKGYDCEVFTYDCLEFAWGQVKEERIKWQKQVDRKKAGEGYILVGPSVEYYLDQALYDQEHVTPYMIRNKEVRKGLVKKIGKPATHINLCVDKLEDIPRLEKFIENENKFIYSIKTKASNDNTQ